MGLQLNSMLSCWGESSVVEVEKRVCTDCLNDECLVARIKAAGITGECSYCHEEGYVVSIDTLADWVDAVFPENFKPGDDEPVFSKDSDNPDWEMKGEPLDGILMDMLETSDKVVSDLIGLLSAREAYGIARDGDIPVYDETWNYEEVPVDSQDHRYSWQEYRHSIMHSRRFYNDSMSEFMEDLFKDIEKYRFGGRQPAIREIATSSADPLYLYRSRRANLRADRVRILQNPESELASPPPMIAPSGRMNARGISVFYAAFDEATALAELRLVPGEVAITAKFSIVEPIRVIDLVTMKTVYDRLSYFDDAFRQKASKLAFLRSFDSEITKPVLPSEESLEYLPTQALVEFLFNNYSAAVDAIIYSSSQTKGDRQNIAIKYAASRVLSKQRGEGRMQKEPELRELWRDYGYSLYRPVKMKGRIMPGIDGAMEDFDPDYYGVQPHLALHKDAVRIHKVEAIEYKLTSESVSFSFLDEHEEDLKF